MIKKCTIEDAFGRLFPSPRIELGSPDYKTGILTTRTRGMPTVGAAPTNTGF